MFNFFQLTAEEQWISLSGTQYQYILYISIQWILNTIFSHFSVVFYSHFFFFLLFLMNQIVEAYQQKNTFINFMQLLYYFIYSHWRFIQYMPVGVSGQEQGRMEECWFRGFHMLDQMFFFLRTKNNFIYLIISCQPWHVSACVLCER